VLRKEREREKGISQKERKIRNQIRSEHNKIKHVFIHVYAAAFFLGVAFFGAAFLTTGLAAVFVTRPDLVLVKTLGCSTIAGAAVEVLRGLAVFALGLAVVFLVATAFFAGLAAAFLAAGFLVVVVVVVALGAAAGFYGMTVSMLRNNTR
jgi:hypothetical protein